MVLPSAQLLTSDVRNSCQLQPLNPQGVKGKNDLHRSLCQEILLTCFTTPELVVFAKKRSCNSQAEVVVDVRGAKLSCRVRALRLECFPGDVTHAGSLDPLPEPEPHSPGVLTTVGALGWGMKSEKQLCAMFPSPSCPYWVWDLGFITIHCSLELLSGKIHL